MEKEPKMQIEMNDIEIIKCLSCGSKNVYVTKEQIFVFAGKHEMNFYVDTLIKCLDCEQKFY